MKYHYRHKLNLKRILLSAFSLTIFGFVLDLNELDPSRIQNLIDITVMTSLLFALGCLIYLMIMLVVYLIPKEI